MCVLRTCRPVERLMQRPLRLGAAGNVPAHSQTGAPCDGQAQRAAQPRWRLKSLQLLGGLSCRAIRGALVQSNVSRAMWMWSAGGLSRRCPAPHREVLEAVAGRREAQARPLLPHLEQHLQTGHGLICEPRLCPRGEPAVGWLWAGNAAGTV